jgi:LPXTG-motif cell wall-anchored protein
MKKLFCCANASFLLSLSNRLMAATSDPTLQKSELAGVLTGHESVALVVLGLLFIVGSMLLRRRARKLHEISEYSKAAGSGE